MTDAPAAPPIDGILETALYVQDLSRAAAFYETILGLKRLFGDERLVAFDAGRRTVLLLFQHGTTGETVRLPGGTIPPHGGSGHIHIAFAVAEDVLPRMAARLAAAGVAVEGETRWPRGSVSIYVRDPDGHLVEFATPGLWTTY